MIDDNFWLVDLGEGKALLADPRPHSGLADRDGVGIDWIIGSDTELLAQRRCLIASTGQPWQRDRIEMILRPGNNAQHHQWLAAGRLQAVAEFGIIIASAAQQRLQQRGIFTCAPFDLRSVGGFTTMNPQRR